MGKPGKVIQALVLIVTLGALLMGSPSSLRAQNAKDPNWVYIDQGTAGVTWCVAGGVRTVYNDEMYRDSFDRLATQAHERIHQQQLRDRSLCNATPQQMLQMEAEAYCYADAVLGIHSFGIPADSVDKHILASLDVEFLNYISPLIVEQVWEKECGAILATAAPDGTSVKTPPEEQTPPRKGQ